MRRLILSGTLNTRDLGGYPAGDGRVTKYRRFIRSDLPTNLNQGDEQKLLDERITTVIDFRGDAEAEKSPCHFKGIEGFDYHHIKMHLVMQLPSSEQEVVELYMGMANDHSSMQQIFKTLANAPGGALYHCSAGKDRTGVVSAILLSNAGVARPDILADYTISYAYMLPLLRQLSANYTDYSAYILQSKVEYMDEFLDSFFDRYASAENYLRTLGLDQGEIQNLKDKLLV